MRAFTPCCSSCRRMPAIYQIILGKGGHATACAACVDAVTNALTQMGVEWTSDFGEWPLGIAARETHEDDGAYHPFIEHQRQALAGAKTDCLCTRPRVPF